MSLLFFLVLVTGCVHFDEGMADFMIRKISVGREFEVFSAPAREYEEM